MKILLTNVLNVKMDILLMMMSSVRNVCLDVKNVPRRIFVMLLLMEHLLMSKPAEYNVVRDIVGHVRTKDNVLLIKQGW